jgi:hypothetical protein
MTLGQLQGTNRLRRVNKIDVSDARNGRNDLDTSIEGFVTNLLHLT